MLVAEGKVLRAETTPWNFKLPNSSPISGMYGNTITAVNTVQKLEEVKYTSFN